MHHFWTLSNQNRLKRGCSGGGGGGRKRWKKKGNKKSTRHVAISIGGERAPARRLESTRWRRCLNRFEPCWTLRQPPLECTHQGATTYLSTNRGASGPPSGHLSEDPWPSLLQPLNRVSATLQPTLTQFRAGWRVPSSGVGYRSSWKLAIDFPRFHSMSFSKPNPRAIKRKCNKLREERQKSIRF